MKIMTDKKSQLILSRNHVHVSGEGSKVMMLAHGFGCDQNMWRFMLPALEKEYKVVLFDYVGSGHSKVTDYDKNRYRSLEGYALDVIEICDALDLQDVVFLGHSVSSFIGLIASFERPDLIDKIAMVCPSPCFLNLEPDYKGGFAKEDLEELINLMDKNYIGWANYLAPLVMGAPISDEFTQELSGSFCSTDPSYAKPFAKATFFSDYRHLLPKTKPACLIIQSDDDVLASVEIGKYMEENIPNAQMEILKIKGHCLHMTDPEAVTKRVFKFLGH